MEDVLQVYSRPRDEKRPLVCLDEMCKQLIADVRDPQPALPGLAARVDYEYERRGMCSAFMVYAPLEKWRGVRVTGQRTALGTDHQVAVQRSLSAGRENRAGAGQPQHAHASLAV